MSDLERAIEIAAHAHRGQRGKGGEALVLHPLRMMLRCADDTSRQAAVLHDVVEKSAWTLAALRDEGFADEVIAAVDALTRREGEPYLDYVRRAARHPIGRDVKVLDLEDHLERMRTLGAGSELTAKRERYVEALRLLGDGAESRGHDTDRQGG